MERPRPTAWGMALLQASFGVDPSRWRLLTGAPEAVRSLAVQGFRVPHGDTVQQADGAFDIAHTGKLILVDPHGAVRGFYDSDADGFDEVFWRSRHVLQEAAAIREAVPAP